MGIREEIEKLRLWQQPVAMLRREFVIHNKVLDNVLSILDKWECVEETKIDFEGEIGLVRWDAENYCQLVYRFKGNPEDHIITYRRKKR